MIIQKNTTKQRKSIYKCDRCKTILERGKDEIYTIFVKSSKNKNAEKKWDLCEKDYRALERGIEKKK